MMLAKTIPVIAVLAVLVATGVGANSTAWPLAAANGSNVFDVRDFGAAGDGTTLDTEAIAKAIRAAAAGGGTVVFRSGVYRTGTFELLSNVTLDLQAGAVIQGSQNLADYAPIEAFGFGRTYGVNSTGEGQNLGIIVARNVENVAIIGHGG
jgi:polygalacturonase